MLSGDTIIINVLFCFLTYLVFATMLQSTVIEAFNKTRPAGAEKFLCHAPFKSLFFGMGGKVFACCINRLHTLGVYPQQSIRDIWFGAKADELRAAIRQNDLSKGCQLCGHFLSAGNFEGAAIKNFDYAGWNAAGYPTKMDFELDNTCNLECVMCRGEHSSSIRQNREKKPPLHTPYDAGFLKQLEEFIPHLEVSHFLGGEPFLIPLYFDLWEKMLELNPRISISVQTNATIYNERVKRILDALPVSLSISIDSIEKDTYEAIRVNAKFERTMENIHAFREHCQRKGTRLTISYCPMVQNWRELPRVVEFCNKLGAEVFFNTVTLPAKNSLMHLTAQELADILIFLEKNSLPATNALEIFNKKAFEGAAKQIRYWQRQAGEREKALNGNTISNVLELNKAVRNYVQHALPVNQGEKNRIAQDIESKLEYILRNAEEEDLFGQMQSFLCAIDPVLICDFFPTNEKEHLYSLLKTHAGIN